MPKPVDCTLQKNAVYCMSPILLKKKTYQDIHRVTKLRGWVEIAEKSYIDSKGGLK